MMAICVDAGTTVIKAVRYEDGIEAAVARRPTRVHRPRPGWAEQDMNEVWSALVEVVREVTQDQPAPAFIGITAQGDGVWLVDADGQPTGPALLWNDGRAEAELTGWERDGTFEAAYPVNASRPSTGMPHALLAWLQRHEPERLRSSAAVLSCGGWLFAQLTGHLVVDESDASAPLLDIRSRAWSDQVIEGYGLGNLRRLLPELHDDNHRTSSLTPTGARQLGLPADVPVVLAPYDICATALGGGAVRAGDACLILGTTLCTEIVVDHVPDPAPDAEPTGITVALGIPGLWIKAYPTMAGGDVLEWMADLLGVEDVPAVMTLAAQGSENGAGARFLPYLSPAGERHPFLDPSARGSLTGLSLDASKADIARAVVEGLTMTVRDCLEASGVSLTSLALCGGGAASRFWGQLIADVTGVPVIPSRDSQVGARGAFLVGLASCGIEPDVAAAAEKHVQRGEPLVPDPERHEMLSRRYAEFVALRSAISATWHASDGGDGRRDTADHSAGVRHD